MSHAQLEKIINEAFANAASVTAATQGEIRDAVNEALHLLDTG
jgi:2,3,4,5-tetrahydropyridine-2-carboxylate N-succinyltransferase